MSTEYVVYQSWHGPKFGLGDTFDSGSRLTAGSSFTIGEVSTGASFTPSSTTTLASIDYASVLTSGTNSLIIRLLGDSGGLPDESTVLESWTSVAGPSGVQTISSALKPTLVSGTT